MRDPNRIPKVLAALEEHWLRDPDARLGQIVGNATAFLTGDYDPFYMEDDAFLEAMTYFKEQNSEGSDKT